MENLNEFIYDALTSNSLLTELVKENVFVIDVPEDTHNPVIQFGRIIESNHNKGLRNDTATITVNVYTDDYYTGCNMVKMITETLDRKSDINNGINGIYRELVVETKNEHAYIQTIKFSVK